VDDDVLDEADDLEDVPDLEVPNILLSLDEALSDARLRAYWTRGKGAAKIRWGVKGDFNRCVRHLRKYVADPKGLCAEYHHDALGVWPGREHKKESAGTGEVEEIDVSNRVKTRTPGRYEPQPIQIGEAAAELVEAAVSDKPWSQFDQSDYTPEQWRRACLVDRGEEAGEGKQRYALPVREPDGTLNRNAVHAAAGGHGIAAVKGISDEQRRAVARKLVSLYRNQLEEEPPESLLSLAGMSESAAEPQRVTLREATSPGAMRPAGNRRYRARLIEGDRWGASGYYSRKVLERDAAVFGPGTLMYFDHPTPAEEADRPERSVRDLAAKIVSTPKYEGDGLYADIEVFAHAAPIVEALADSIGLSIRAAGTAEYGEAAGRSGMIVTSLTEGYSVDFVTQAGAGGRLVALLESARHTAVREARTIGAWLESRLHLALTQLADDMYGDGRLSRDERIVLSNAIGEGLKAWTARIEAGAPQLFRRDLYDEPVDEPVAQMREATTEDVRRDLDHLLRRTYGGGDRYLFVHDYDAARGLVWYEVGGTGEPTCWQQGYSRGEDGKLTLSADRVRAERRTIYVPIGDGHGPVYESAGSSTDVTDGTLPAAPTNSPEEEPEMSGTNTGASPGTAGTATVAETAQNTLSAEARAQIAESKLAEAQAQITALQAQNASLTVERDTARGEVRRLRATEAARNACAAALQESDLPAPAQRRITESVAANVPLTEAGEVDTNALTAAITTQVEAERAYIASIREAAGEGTPTGLGGSTPVASTDLSDYRANLAARMQRLGLSEAAAKAAAGR
jgi:hypothetical protein